MARAPREEINTVPDSQSFYRARQRQKRFVEALLSISASGAAHWVRKEIEPSYIHCFVGGDLFLFELSQGEQPFDPSLPVHGIVAHVRNCNLGSGAV